MVIISIIIQFLNRHNNYYQKKFFSLNYIHVATSADLIKIKKKRKKNNISYRYF
jgi:hypothetical protein